MMVRQAHHQRILPDFAIVLVKWDFPLLQRNQVPADHQTAPLEELRFVHIDPDYVAAVDLHQVVQFRHLPIKRRVEQAPRMSSVVVVPYRR